MYKFSYLCIIMQKGIAVNPVWDFFQRRG